MKKNLSAFLDKFDTMPLNNMSRDDLLSLYDELVNFQLTLDGELSDDKEQRLNNAIDAVENCLNKQTFLPLYLEKLLIENPMLVECSLVLLPVSELIMMESVSKEIKSEALRKQFINMVNRCLGLFLGKESTFN